MEKSKFVTFLLPNFEYCLISKHSLQEEISDYTTNFFVAHIKLFRLFPRELYLLIIN